MKWISYIWILIIVYFICSARSCTEDEDSVAKREEQYIMNLTDSVKHVFMSDSLSDKSLRAFEITAIGKLNDFADYMKIISDTTLDLKFRQHAAELVRDLFVPGEIELKNWSKAYSVPGLSNLVLLLEHSLSEGISCWIQPSQINVINPFTQVNDSTVTGSLSFIQNCIPFNTTGQFEIVSGEVVIDIYIIKEIKSFGDKRLRVWEVYLGAIE
jgi:hypothetical protein